MNDTARHGDDPGVPGLRGNEAARQPRSAMAETPENASARLNAYTGRKQRPI